MIIFVAQLYWAKDIIFLFPDMEHIGLLAWLDAYHGVQTSSRKLTNMSTPDLSSQLFMAPSLLDGLGVYKPGLTLNTLN